MADRLYIWKAPRGYLFGLFYPGKDGGENEWVNHILGQYETLNDALMATIHINLLPIEIIDVAPWEAFK